MLCLHYSDFIVFFNQVLKSANMTNKTKTNEAYEQIASYYDNSTNLKVFNTYLALIGNIKNKKILDLGCGTGTLLKHYARDNKTFGIDASPAMIKKAKTKDSRSTYKIGDIRNFKLKTEFNIITCTYDTINHLPTFNDWGLLFKNTASHLSRDGIFLFDFNTIQGLKNNKGALLQEIGNDYIIRQVKIEKQSCLWIFHYFKKASNGSFKHKRSVIKERSFPQKEIEKKVRKYFKIIEIKKCGDNRVYIKAKSKAT